MKLAINDPQVKEELRTVLACILIGGYFCCSAVAIIFAIHFHGWTALLIACCGLWMLSIGVEAYRREKRYRDARKQANRAIASELEKSTS
jgi:hypothetical protein